MKQKATIKRLPSRALAFIKRLFSKKSSVKTDQEAAPVEKIKNNIRSQPVTKSRFAQGGLHYGANPVYFPKRTKLKGWQKQNRTSSFNKNR